MSISGWYWSLEGEDLFFFVVLGLLVRLRILAPFSFFEKVKLYYYIPSAKFIKKQAFSYRASFRSLSTKLSRFTSWSRMLRSKNSESLTLPSSLTASSRISCFFTSSVAEESSSFSSPANYYYYYGLSYATTLVWLCWSPLSIDNSASPTLFSSLESSVSMSPSLISSSGSLLPLWPPPPPSEVLFGYSWEGESPYRRLFAG